MLFGHNALAGGRIAILEARQAAAFFVPLVVPAFLVQRQVARKKHHPVSYTHLKLPTSDLGEITGVAGKLKKKKTTKKN